MKIHTRRSFKPNGTSSPRITELQWHRFLVACITSTRWRKLWRDEPIEMPIVFFADDNHSQVEGKTGSEQYHSTNSVIA
jgi:hypothetical protein